MRVLRARALDVSCACPPAPNPRKILTRPRAFVSRQASKQLAEAERKLSENGELEAIEALISGTAGGSPGGSPGAAAGRADGLDRL